MTGSVLSEGESGQPDALSEYRERIDALETLAAHQEKTIEELNEALLVQWREIDLLKRQIARLDQQVAEVEAGLPAPPITRPPHY